jgi:hypothetical protein
MVMAKEYPRASMAAFDIDGAPLGELLPKNLQFETENVNERWTYDPEGFDLVYARHLHSRIRDWPAFCQMTNRVLKPGVYLEVFSEIFLETPELCSDDQTVAQDYAFSKLLSRQEELMRTIGRKSRTSNEIVEDMKSAGFEEVKMETYKVPIGPWPKNLRLKELGAIMLMAMFRVVDAMAGYMTMLEGKKETPRLSEEAMRSLETRELHAYFKFFCAYGRKAE